MEDSPISTVACVIIGAVSFGVAFILGLIVERSMFSLFTISTISALLMITVFYLLHRVIIYYLPELLVTKENDSVLDDTKHLDIIVDSDSSQMIVGGGKEYTDETSTIDNNNFTLSDHQSITSKSDPKKEKFYQESPEILAKMVRTSLMKDDK